MPCSSCQNPKSNKSGKDKSHKKQSVKVCQPEILKFYPDNPDYSVLTGFFVCNIPATAQEGAIILLPNGRVYQQTNGQWIELEPGSCFFFGDLATLRVYFVRVKDCDEARINVLRFCAHYIPLAECGGSEYYTYIVTDEVPQCLLGLPETAPQVPEDNPLKVFFA